MKDLKYQRILNWSENDWTKRLEVGLNYFHTYITQLKLMGTNFAHSVLSILHVHSSCSEYYLFQRTPDIIVNGNIAINMPSGSRGRLD